MRHKIREAHIRMKTQKTAISDFLRRIMSDTAKSNSNRAPTSPSSERELAKQLIVPKVEAAKTPPQKKNKENAAPSLTPSISKEILYETPKQDLFPESAMMTMTSRRRGHRRKKKMSEP